MYAAIEGIFTESVKKCSSIKAIIKSTAPVTIVIISFFTEFSL